jgi:Tol biopolymer transport system component
MPFGRLTIRAAATVALLTLLSAQPVDLAAATAPGGYIAYQSLRSGRWRIVRMNSDGSGKTVLPGKANNTAPVWLPDGRILFNSDRSGIWNIYTMAADGTDVRLVSSSTRSENHEGIGGGGQLILVRRGLRSFRIRNLGTGVVKPVSFAAFPGTDGELWPNISPDGSRIAFLFKSGSGAQRAVYAAALSEEPTRFVVGPATKVAVGCFNSWAADSSGFLMCIIKDQALGSDLYLASVGQDGSWTKTRVTTAVNWDYFPAWSPDNSWIVWAASPVEYHDHGSPTYEIWARPAAGGDPVRLTTDSYTDNAPSWSAPAP